MRLETAQRNQIHAQAGVKGDSAPYIVSELTAGDELAGSYAGGNVEPGKLAALWSGARTEGCSASKRNVSAGNARVILRQSTCGTTDCRTMSERYGYAPP